MNYRILDHKDRHGLHTTLLKSLLYKLRRIGLTFCMICKICVSCLPTKFDSFKYVVEDLLAKEFEPFFIVVIRKNRLEFIQLPCNMLVPYQPVVIFQSLSGCGVCVIRCIKVKF